MMSSDDLARSIRLAINLADRVGDDRRAVVGPAARDDPYEKWLKLVAFVHGLSLYVADDALQRDLLDFLDRANAVHEAAEMMNENRANLSPRQHR